LDAEQLLDRALDVDLRRADRHLEHDRPRILAQQRRLLGDQRTPDDVCQFHVRSLPASCFLLPAVLRALAGQRDAGSGKRASYPRLSCSFSIASRVAMTCAVSYTSRAVTRELATRRTPARFRA